MPYHEVTRRVLEHHRAAGELVDFRLDPGVAIVAAYRVRAPDQPTWTDLLPTDTRPDRYREMIQRLAPALFPSETVVIRSIRRRVDEVEIELEPRQ